jgi:hypothetical protein
MKSLLKLLLLTLCFSGIAESQTPTFTVLHYKQNYVVPKDGAIVLSNENFGEYYYVFQQYDTLRSETIALQSVIKQQDSLNCAVVSNYDNLIVTKDKSLEEYKTANTSLETIGNQCGTEKKQLQTDYLKLEQKHNRAKRWRNIFLGSTAFSTGILILLIAI